VSIPEGLHRASRALLSRPLLRASARPQDVSLGAHPDPVEDRALLDRDIA
jgi:hypothetical protein